MPVRESRRAAKVERFIGPIEGREGGRIAIALLKYDVADKFHTLLNPVKFCRLVIGLV